MKRDSNTARIVHIEVTGDDDFVASVAASVAQIIQQTRTPAPPEAPAACRKRKAKSAGSGLAVARAAQPRSVKIARGGGA
ncbi:MAG: hypothetical protein KF684_04245 [Phycisphaeraceae bacterium]|nr:hypothetical protein [Phycisphaeraceae bacterium]